MNLNVIVEGIEDEVQYGTSSLLKVVDSSVFILLSPGTS